MVDCKEFIALHIDSLQPTPEEYGDNAQFFYWMDYACELDELIVLGYQDDNSKIVERLNRMMTTLSPTNPVHHACTDVATTLESRLTEFKGVFTYGA